MNEVIIYVNILGVSPIDGYETFVPQPKLGNLVDPVKIAKKEEEHWSKFESNPEVCPIICKVDRISFALTSTVYNFREGEEDEVTHSGVKVGTVEDLIREVNDDPSNLYEIVSLDPTRCMHLLRVHILRSGLVLPDFLRPGVHTINPVKALLGSDAEWPSCMEALCQESVGPTEDCIWLNSQWRRE